MKKILNSIGFYFLILIFGPVLLVLGITSLVQAVRTTAIDPEPQTIHLNIQELKFVPNETTQLPRPIYGEYYSADIGNNIDFFYSYNSYKAELVFIKRIENERYISLKTIQNNSIWPRDPKLWLLSKDNGYIETISIKKSLKNNEELILLATPRTWHESLILFTIGAIVVILMGLFFSYVMIERTIEDVSDLLKKKKPIT